jgi:hypothetical protein
MSRQAREELLHVNGQRTTPLRFSTPSRSFAPLRRWTAKQRSAWDVHGRYSGRVTADPAKDCVEPTVAQQRNITTRYPITASAPPSITHTGLALCAGRRNVCLARGTHADSARERRATMNNPNKIVA